MSCVAKPMTWPNLRIGSPLAIRVIAILWPFITRSSAVTPAGTLPFSMTSMATTTLSAALSLIVRGAFALV